MDRHRDLSWIQLRGSPKEIGRTYGKAFKQIFIAHSEALRERLKFYDSVSLEEARLNQLETLQKHFPYLAEEMNGIAEATCLDPRIVQLAHVTIDRVVKESIAPRPKLDGDQKNDCSNVIFTNSDRGPLLGKTLDGSSKNGPDRLMAKISPKNGHGMLVMMYLGKLNAETGVNEKGLAVGNSSIHFNSMNPRGINRQLLIRLLLQECANTEEGIEFLKKYGPINSGYNFMLLDKNGDAANVERSPTDYCIRRPRKGVLFCVNHCVCKNMTRDERPAMGMERHLNSKARWANFQSITSREDFEMAFETMKNILRNHASPGGICQHGFAGMYTSTSFILIPLERNMLFTVGNACQSEFQVLSFD